MSLQRELAWKHMNRQHIQKIFDSVWNIEKLDKLNTLTGLMVFPAK
jgi:hypothetical protein